MTLKIDRMNRTALMYAIADRREDEALRLIAGRGDDVRATDRNGWTALHFAAQSDMPRVAGALLDAGAEVDAVNVHGNTPLSTALFNYRGDPSLVNLLVARGANADRPNKHGVSPRKLAQTVANVDLVSVLRAAEAARGSTT